MPQCRVDLPIVRLCDATRDFLCPLGAQQPILCTGNDQSACRYAPQRLLEIAVEGLGQVVRA